VGAVNATSDLIADANQNELVDFTATGSAVNHVGITNAATGNGPTIEAKGDDTNIDLNVSGKGTGKLATTSPKITTGINDSNNNELIKVTSTGSAVNEITVANAATGNGPTLSATGDDTNIDLNIAGKGSGSAKFTSNIIIPDAGNIGSVSDPDAIAIASDGGLTFNGGIDNAGTISAGTIGSNVVFPSGKLVNSSFKKLTSGSRDTTNESLTAAFNSESVSCTVGNTILFGFHFQIESFRTTGDATNRKGTIALYQNTSSFSANDSGSSLGTELFNSQAGRTLTGNSGQAASSYDVVNAFAVFEATATTHHLGIASAGSHNPNVITRVYATSGNPLYFYFYEFEGDVLT
jgi:hypothetical protein